MTLITAGDFGRAKVGAQHPPRRAGFLDLGDHRRPPGGDAIANRAEKIAGRRLPFRVGAQRHKRHVGPGGNDLCTLDGENAVENVAAHRRVGAAASWRVSRVSSSSSSTARWSAREANSTLSPGP
jgi:hypothetical protein